MVLSSLTLGPMARNITRYRRGVRIWAVLLVVACGKDAKEASRAAPAHKDAGVAVVAIDGAPPAGDVKHDSYPDLGSALTAIVPANTRVIGFGELHARTDRAQVQS